MATKKKQALPFSRQNAFAAPPEELIIIGLDTGHGPEHPLYDPRIKDPIEESFVRNIDHYGVLEEVLVCKDGDDKVVVIAGRRRVRAARLANIERQKRGEMPMKVRVSEKKGDDKHLSAIVVIENEQRREDTPLNRARKANRMRDLGASDDEICLAFGCTKQTLNRWLSLLDLAPAVQGAVEEGKIGATAAAKLAGLSRVEQCSQLAKLLKAGKVTTAAAERTVKKRNGVPVATKPSGKFVATLAKDPVFLDGLDKQARGLLRWLQGDQDGALDVPGLDARIAEHKEKRR